MEIYVVRGGDSLYSLSRRFGVSVEALAEANQLSDPSRLTPGLALVIPGTPAGALTEIEVNAYAYPNIPDATLRETLPYLTYLCPFSHSVTAQGELRPLGDGRMLSAAEEYSTATLLTVTNLGDNGSFSGDIAHAVLTDPQAQDRFLESIIATAERKGSYGINFNIEYIYPYDRDSYSQFLRRAAETLHPLGYLLSTAVAPKYSDDQQGLIYSAHDYAAHGQYMDRVVIMTYEWGYTYSSPQAVSPVDKMRLVLQYALTRMPAGKILMGFSNYGYNWRLPWRQGEPARVISNAAAANLAVSVGAAISYDLVAQAPYYSYTDAAGERRQVWFEDARSVQARLELVREYGLGGISVWTVNQLYRPALELLHGSFGTEKAL